MLVESSCGYLAGALLVYEKPEQSNIVVHYYYVSQWKYTCHSHVEIKNNLKHA